MIITSENQQTGEQFTIPLKACTVIAACDGWKGPVDGAMLEILDCGAVRLLASAASLSALAVFL